MSKRHNWGTADTTRLRYLATTTEMTDVEIARVFNCCIETVRRHAAVHEIVLNRADRQPAITPEAEARAAAEWLEREVRLGRSEIEAHFGKIDPARIKRLQQERRT
jgi:hypothetical protein